MSSVKCPQCNLTNWATAITCKRCGGFLQSVEEHSADASFSAEQEQNFGVPNQNINSRSSDSIGLHAEFKQAQFASEPNYAQQNQQFSHPNNFQYQTYNHRNYQPKNLKSGLAIASMILGIIGFVTMILLIGMLVAPVGLVLGIIALVKANKKPEIYGGKGFAIAGIVTSSVVVVFVPIVLAITVPNLLASRRVANEASAISTLKTISAAQTSYMASSYGKCGDLPTLIATRLIDTKLANGEKNGYRFMVINLPAGGCEILATPLSASQGTRSFYYSTEDGVIRGAAKKGLPANRNDFPIKNDFSDKLNQVSDNRPNEAAAISLLRTIQTAEASYAATVGQGEGAADLQTLAMQGLIKQDLADGEDAGYRFRVVKFPQKGWEIYATPVSSAYGVMSLYMGTDGVIRGLVKNGTPAGKNDPPVNL